MKNMNLMYIGLVISASLATANVSAAITGQIDVKLNITSGCVVGNSEADGNMNKFGTLDFGQAASSLTNVLTSGVIASDGGSDIKVKCDKAVDGFNISIDGGQKGERLLANGTDTIKYDIYQDAARSKVYGVDEQVTFKNSSGDDGVSVPIFGAVPVQTGAKSEGDYTDSLLVTLSF